MPILTVDGHEVSVSIRPKSATDPTLLLDFYRPDGKRVRWSTRTADPQAAARCYESLRGRIERECRKAAPGAVPESRPDPRLAEVVAYYLTVYLPNKNAAKKTITKSTQVLTEFVEWCAARKIGRLQQVSRAAVDAHAAALRETQSAKSISVRLGIVRACLNAAVDGGIADGHAVKKWLMPSVPEPEIHPLTPEELALVLETVKEKRPDLYNVVAWIAHTGQRPSDAIDLRWGQVDTATKTVVRTQVKTARLASFEISDAAVALVKAEAARWETPPGKSAPVFTSRHREPFTVNKLYHDFTRCLSGVKGIPAGVNPKVLRHTFGYTMVNLLGCPLPTVQVLMGHRDIATTLKYVRPGAAHRYVNGLAGLLQGTKTLPEARSPRTGQRRAKSGAGKTTE